MNREDFEFLFFRSRKEYRYRSFKYFGKFVLAKINGHARFFSATTGVKWSQTKYFLYDMTDLPGAGEIENGTGYIYSFTKKLTNARKNYLKEVYNVPIL